jgi:hypothetical protein
MAGHDVLVIALRTLFYYLAKDEDVKLSSERNWPAWKNNIHFHITFRTRNLQNYPICKRYNSVKQVCATDWVQGCGGL